MIYSSSRVQVPEEEKNLGPQDRLIHVYHFMKDPQNMNVSGIPHLSLSMCAFTCLHDKSHWADHCYQLLKSLGSFYDSLCYDP